MTDRKELLRTRETVQDQLDDLEFERFAVMSGVAPKQLLGVSAQIAEAEAELQGCNDALNQLDGLERERAARKNPERLRTMKQSQFDDIFESIVATWTL